jgi:signal transduction histidine kinase
MSATAREHGPSADERIMIVDDNPRNVLILKKLLAEYSLCVAGTGEEALALAGEFQPDLILLDIMMPGINGYETCRRLRAMKDSSTPAKIIMVSARAIVTERLQGYEAGADDYVTKPFDPDELLAKVKVYLRLKSMEQLERLRDSLITLLSHETRTPIACLLSASELIRARGQASSELRDMLDTIEAATRRLHRLIDRVVLLSSLRADAVVLDRTPTSMAAVAEMAVEQLRPQAEERQIEMQHVAGGDAHVLLDPRFVELVLHPLIHNAIRFTAPGGHVTVRTEEDDDYDGVVLRIQDDGCGIERDLLPQVTQGLLVSDIAHHGHGLGLSLPTASLFTRKHGGRFKLTSVFGEGTCVTLHLPPAAADLGDAEPSGRVA